MNYKKINDNLLQARNIHVRDLTFYVNTSCNLRCKHCYVGNEWLNKAFQFEHEDASAILNHFASSGLDRLTFLGGEPTLYPYLSDLIEQTRSYSIGERRITTNGVNLKYLDFDRITPKDLDHISFSFDGHTAQIHDYIRGKGTFDASVGNLKLLQKKGFQVYVTFTVMKTNIFALEDAVVYFNRLGVPEVNFHVISIIGNAALNKDLAITPTDWIKARSVLSSMDSVKSIRLRIPQMFVTTEEYEIEKQNGYLPFQNGSYHCPNGGHRIVLYPNGRVYMSCDLTGSEYHFATYNDGLFIPNENWNELSEFETNPDNSDPSAKLLGVPTEAFIPLSISYKKIISY